MLSPSATQLIHDYLNLPFPGLTGVRCPYFNNWKLRQRGQLRVLIGKGTPKEIVEEAKIISIQYHANLFDKSGNCCLPGENPEKSAEEIRKFLINNNLGIDCSGFAAHVLAAHYKETKNENLFSKLNICSAKNIFRWLICKLRPVENIGVGILGSKQNSELVWDGKTKTDFSLIQPADIIAIYGTGPQRNRNHIILITQNNGKTLSYVHARAWPSEGKYGHGAAEGTIEILKPKGKLEEQKWTELGKCGHENETYGIEVRMARQIEIKRIKFT